MKLISTWLTAVTIAASSVAAQAHSFTFGALEIGHPYSRSTVTGQTAGGAFLSVDNKGADDRLVSASSEVSASVELHTMKLEGDVMRMRQVDGVPVPGGATTKLAPGGFHIMLIGLKAPLKTGDKFPLKLRFEKAGDVTVQVAVEGPSASH